ncbi:helix-turn-helix domain-containing protein [Amycolatopsis magusensis]|uniref:helix-turn-helix domain-containing protein n=1 Tax=Amycolatopsis magusensis TaxID=882444 RepID=UPI0037AD6D17
MAGSVNQDPDFDADHRRALGKRLRELRLSRGVKAEELRDQLHDDLCVGTLLSYEVGDRRMTVQRYVEICKVLGVNASVLLEQVDRDLGAAPIWVRASLLSKTRDPQLRPLRTWAAARHVGVPVPSARRLIEFDRRTLLFAAQLCGLDPEELASRLQGMCDKRSCAAETG